MLEEEFAEDVPEALLVLELLVFGLPTFTVCHEDREQLLKLNNNIEPIKKTKPKRKFNFFIYKEPLPTGLLTEDLLDNCLTNFDL